MTLRPPRVVRFRRSPHLVTFWRGRDLVVHNIATGAQALAGPIVCGLLDTFDTWRSIANVTAGRSRAETIPLAAIVRELARRSFLERSDRARSAQSRAMDEWGDWNPAAGFFHFSTKDISYETNVVAADSGREAELKPEPDMARDRTGEDRPDVEPPNADLPDRNEAAESARRLNDDDDDLVPE